MVMVFAVKVGPWQATGTRGSFRDGAGLSKYGAHPVKRELLPEGEKKLSREHRRP